ncbi:hypothetical protein QOT17_010669 [Balamuthia mandrillaris]
MAENDDSDFLPVFPSSECEGGRESLQGYHPVKKHDHEEEGDFESGVSNPLFHEINYNLNLGLWIQNGWRMYKANWFQHSAFEFLFWSITVLPYMAGWMEETLFCFTYVLSNFLYWLLSPLKYGHFIVGSHLLRSRAGSTANPVCPGASGGHYTFQFKDLFRGVFLYLPLLFLGLFWYFAVYIGLLLCVAPGVYLAVTMAFGFHVYIEYHHMRATGVTTGSLGVFDALAISRHVVHKNFCTNLLFFIIYFLVCLVGALCFGVGLLVARPVMELAMVFAFHDQFKLLPNRDLDRVLLLTIKLWVGEKT